jgi:hypothetical protein
VIEASHGDLEALAFLADAVRTQFLLSVEAACHFMFGGKGKVHSKAPEEIFDIISQIKSTDRSVGKISIKKPDAF